MAVIQGWKVAGVLTNPNGIHLYAKVPYGQVNVVKDKQEKEKIRTKPDRKREAWKSPAIILLIALPTPTIPHTQHTGDTCGNDSHFGYDCSPQFPLNYEPEPGYIQNYNSYPHDSPSFPQQYPCCVDCGVTHEPYQCQPKNHDYYHEQNSCYDSNSIGFDQSQPQEYTVNHPIFNAHHELLGSQKKLNITLTKVIEQMTQLTSICEMACQLVQKKQEEKQIEEEQAAKAQTWKLPVCYDDDDDEEGYNSLNDNIIFELPPYSAVTPSEPIDSLSMGDEHLNTILAMESDEFIESCVENLVPNPSESEGENGCDVLAGFTTFSNVLFNTDYDSDSSDYHIPGNMKTLAKDFVLKSSFPLHKFGNHVRNKREKDKIGTKPDQIKKKREAWKSPEVSKTNYSQESRK
nr:hypothetical protein [Tanacetum cinerariifolium]